MVAPVGIVPAGGVGGNRPSVLPSLMRRYARSPGGLNLRVPRRTPRQPDGGGDGVEEGPGADADGGDGDEADDADQGQHQAVLDRRGAFLAGDEPAGGGGE